MGLDIDVHVEILKDGVWDDLEEVFPMAPQYDWERRYVEYAVMGCSWVKGFDWQPPWACRGLPDYWYPEDFDSDYDEMPPYGFAHTHFTLKELADDPPWDKVEQWDYQEEQMPLKEACAGLYAYVCALILFIDLDTHMYIDPTGVRFIVWFS